MQAAESGKAGRAFGRPCAFFAQGTCRNGASCRFSHGDPRTSAAGASGSSHMNGRAAASSNGQRTATTNGSAAVAASLTQTPSAADNGASSSSSAARPRDSVPVVNGTKGIEREAIRDAATMGEENGGNGRTHAAWGEAFLEGVTKCEGTSGRKLYLYGISSTRCPMCRHRIKIESDVCDNCEYRHQRARSCKMCTLQKPSMWCYECDSYFCEACHQKPHVLVFGGNASVAHHCYAVEGASGKLHKKSAWSMDFLATVKSVYRLRISETMEASATRQAHDARQSHASSHNTSAPSLPPTTSSSPSRDAAESTARRAEQQAEPRPVVAADASQSTPAVQEETQELRTQRDGAALDSSDTASSTTTPQTQQTTGVSAGTATTAVSATATTVATDRSDGAVTTPATPAVPELSSPSRKRKLPSDAEPGRAIPPPPAAAASLPLYERVRLMHEQTAKLKFQNQQELLRQRQQQQQQDQQERERSQQQRLQEMQTFREQLQAKHEKAKAVQENLQRQQQQQFFLLHQRRQELQRRQQEQQQLQQQQQSGQQSISQPTPPPFIAPATSPVSSASQTIATSTTAAAATTQALSSLPPQPATSVPLASPHHLQAQQQTLSHQPSPTHQPGVGAFAPQVPAPAAAANAPVNLSGARSAATPAPPQNMSFVDGPSSTEDPLKFAVVSEYDEVNNRAIKMEMRTAELNVKVRQVSMQSVTLAAKFSEQIKVYRTTLEQVYEQRYVALAKVIMFSPDVRARVRMIEQSTLGDIPHVLTACHKKCAQLATDIKSYEKNVQNLRDAIDAAISSGDPEKLGQLHLLGKQISSHEQKIQSLKADRDSQFVYMIQFSRKLREVVRQHAVQNSKASAS